MNEVSYIVRKGDSLTRIARDHGTSAQAIAEANRLTNIDRIEVGQRLIIPAAKPGSAKPVSQPVASTEERTLFVQFVDALNAPIENLRVSIKQAEEALEHLTDQDGKVPPIPVLSAATPVVVKVEKASGGWKELTQIVAQEGSTYVRLRSPKLQLDSSMRPHEGGAQPATGKPEPKPPGTVVQIRSPAGNPVQQVSLECPNPQNLKLGPNLKYRDVVLAASQRSGFIPQAIAAIMNAEAAKLSVMHEEKIIDKKSGKPALDKAGKPRIRKWREVTGEWDARSASPLSSARGMTQFLDGSWMDQALTDGTYLNAKAKKEGWVTTTTIEVATKKTTTQKVVPAFKLADGKFETRAPLARTLSARPYLTARATASDTNLQELLDLRFEAEYAIQTAVDYGMQNLAALERVGFKVANLNDGEKAKVIYLTHHLGLADAKRYINKTLTAEHAQYLLENQLGKYKAAERADEFKGDYLLTHRKWLTGFVDDSITLSPRMCDATTALSVRDIATIAEAIRVSLVNE